MNIHRWGSHWLRFFFAFMVFAGGCANNSNLSEQQSTVQTQTENPPSQKSHVFVLKVEKEDLDKWPDRLWNDSKATFTKPENIAALLLAGGASVAMNQDTDKEIADYFDKYNKLHNWKDESLNIIGSPTTHFAASSVWYFFSQRNKDSLNKERAWTMRTALTITWLTTAALKTARNNDTPNGKNRAWPSGHTSSSFTVASVLDEYYGPKVGIPAYAIASLVGYRMMDTGDHWGSDVLFGATLGWIVGHTVAGQNKDLEIAGYKVVPFVPVSEKPAFGIGLVKRF
ncbi:MAG: phosphatase PAP2 family protein [Sedimentisphaerales bacterium]|nr:phosphatase PAP2 family protein [Sedimentisphaerales bacterium]